ncbi:MAG: pyridoxamine 5'-phosphate oxidase family protein [Alphaproteobacteria bacterium]|nr:pyridoxamine 5'-phosphate oxidase family protein [Alphaproteobacteria bacterium]
MGVLTSEMVETLEKQRLGFVATVSENGEPNVSPKGTFVVIDGATIAFGEIRSPMTLENLRARPAVEVNFVDPLARRGFRAKGTATIRERGSAAFLEHIARFDRWGDLAKRIRNIVVIDVRIAQPLTSPAYDDGATEAELRAQWAKVLLSD